MKIILLFCLFLFPNFNSYSQTIFLDSLIKEYYKTYDSAKALQYISNAIGGIEKEKDEYTDKITFRTDLLKPISISKVIIKGKSVYYLSLQTKGATLNTNIKGVYLLFTDGKKWIKMNEAVDLDYDEGYNYSAFIRLSSEDLKLFQTKKVSRFRLYIYDGNVSYSDSERFILQTNFIQKLK